MAKRTWLYLHYVSHRNPKIPLTMYIYIYIYIDRWYWQAVILMILWTCNMNNGGRGRWLITVATLVYYFGALFIRSGLRLVWWGFVEHVRVGFFFSLLGFSYSSYSSSQFISPPDLYPPTAPLHPLPPRAPRRRRWHTAAHLKGFPRSYLGNKR